ncbi:BlaI/MecI/CopY family transcriptional regulator [Serpentinicella alkaliphila]|uniref:BlaI family penicillinase repressor n=1 Tax=Serpentinicella alkaliphila TaxID=1734049 RepID=A0A4R2UA11_9FIRM|nr:BlaI/MecI/CopY family transcriptional regulator [Serpentinicella alkaliphila]QUH25209.1 BlaI/MecI/CopY family transcriptional regulator [Serpentinicella alkaliphila]TCQ07019.1 BlaI family penicillinase repressor [Serpentinicella alkaliphila]
MKRAPNITDAEWEVMKLIWNNNPSTSEQIISALSPKMGWSAQTIKTLINRLLKKGIIDFEKEGRIYKYYPLVPREDYIKTENRSFLEKVYDGALSMLVSNFLEEESLSENEIEKIQKILEKKKHENQHNKK